jgi:hypothetical protein
MGSRAMGWCDAKADIVKQNSTYHGDREALEKITG